MLDSNSIQISYLLTIYQTIDAPNSLTNTNYDKPHLEATKAMVQKLDQMICAMLNDTRFQVPNLEYWKYRDPNHNSKALTDATWKDIRDYGPLTCLDALALGLVDTNVPLDPLDLMLSEKASCVTQKPPASRQEESGQLILNSIVSHIPTMRATRKVTLEQYTQILERRKRAKARDEMKVWKVHEAMTKLSETPFFDTLLNNLKISAPYFNIPKEEFIQSTPRQEKIALVHVNGGITTSQAQSVVESLRKIKNDPNISCVVLRVDSSGGSSLASEHILMELAAIPQPVVCSMGNYAASGGYYVASNSHRIFALPTTITGSIGIFAIKFDARDFAKRYGIKVEHVSTGPHSVGLSPFAPLNKETKASFERIIGDGYDWFKTLVSVGRRIPINEIDNLAQGRIWTGEDAKELGLVDELGGLDRAIAYAQRNLTLSHNASVEVWPKPKSFFERVLSSTNEQASILQVMTDIFVQPCTRETHWFDVLSPEGIQAFLEESTPVSGQLMLTMNESEAIKLCLEEFAHRRNSS